MRRLVVTGRILRAVRTLNYSPAVTSRVTNYRAPASGTEVVRRLCWCALVIIPLGAGCSAAKTAPVSGRVTLDGQTLAGVHVAFQPVAKAGDIYPGGGSYAITDGDGRFTLLLVDGEKPGAVIGQHRVEISARSEIPANIDVATRPRPKVFVPEKYSRNSALTFDVPTGGTTAADFALSSQ